jgi:hypothetical protein
MKTQFKSIIHTMKYSLACILICSLVLVSCEPNKGRMDTESNKDFPGEDNSSTSDPNDPSSNPAEVRADSTPAAHPDLDDNPIMDEGMSTDSAWESESNKRQRK